MSDGFYASSDGWVKVIPAAGSIGRALLTGALVMVPALAAEAAPAGRDRSGDGVAPARATAAPLGEGWRTATPHRRPRIAVIPAAPPRPLRDQAPRRRGVAPRSRERQWDATRLAALARARAHLVTDRPALARRELAPILFANPRDRVAVLIYVASLHATFAEVQRLPMGHLDSERVLAMMLRDVFLPQDLTLRIVLELDRRAQARPATAGARTAWATATAAGPTTGSAGPQGGPGSP